jgi:hypothetical protein
MGRGVIPGLRIAIGFAKWREACSRWGMVAFIVPLQSPQVSANWGMASVLCERTLRSICQQTSDNFRVFLVCNTAPSLNFSHPALTIIEDEFPIPAPNSADRMYDKHEKLKRGLIAAREMAPCPVMLADADDVVHRRLVEWCEQYPQSPGWYVPDGYIYTAGSPWLYKLRDFDQICGTSIIVDCKDSDFPKAMSDRKSDFFMVERGHFEFRNPDRIGGIKLQPLPFPGAIYVTSTGENYTGSTLRGWQGKKMFIKKVLNARPLTKRIREDFGLYEVDNHAAAGAG